MPVPRCPVGLQGTGLGSPAVRGALSRAAWHEVTFKGGVFQVKALLFDGAPRGHVVAVTGGLCEVVCLCYRCTPRSPARLAGLVRARKESRSLEVRMSRGQAGNWCQAGGQGAGGGWGRAVPAFTCSSWAKRALQRVIGTWTALPCPQLLQSPPERSSRVPE